MSEPKTAVEVECDNPGTAALPLDTNDPEVLRAALVRENIERRRAECLAKIQTDVVKFAVDLLVREPDIDGFFRALLKTLAEEGESHAAGVWLIDDDRQGCDLWMVHLDDQVFTRGKPGVEDDDVSAADDGGPSVRLRSRDGIRPSSTSCDDQRLPGGVARLHQSEGLSTTVITPLVLSGNNLGWVTLCAVETPECPGQWWRIALIEAMATAGGAGAPSQPAGRPQSSRRAQESDSRGAESAGA